MILFEFTFFEESSKFEQFYLFRKLFAYTIQVIKS